MMTGVTESRELSTPTSRRRAVLDGIRKGIDVTIGVVAIIAGVVALVATPVSIIREVSLPGLVIAWGASLIIGGFMAALGRLTGIWILETVGIAAAATGTLIYAIVISTSVRLELGVAVALGLIVIALLAMIRRYVELQIFLSEPNDRGFFDRLRAALKLRTSTRPIR